jgi:hypothetical protein
LLDLPSPRLHPSLTLFSLCPSISPILGALANTERELDQLKAEAAGTAPKQSAATQKAPAKAAGGGGFFGGKQ